MKTKQYLVTVVCLLSAYTAWSIQEYDIRFRAKEIKCDERQVCYETQIRSADGQEWNLAGQNYRFYFDASMGSYVSGSLQRSPDLNAQMYSDVLLTTHVPSVDASGIDGLDIPFASTVGFLNYSVDLMNLATGGENLPANGDWVSTTEFCFDVTQEVIDEGAECMNIVWARMGRTDLLATAFVEVSQWVGAQSTTEALTNEFDDLDAEDGFNSCLALRCGEDVQNEVTIADCSDGFDNDNDGLVDCADPDCVGTVACPVDPKDFQLSLALNTADINCSTGMVCYNVNLSSGDNRSFTLGNQTYQLFYNTAIGSFVNGTSFLGASYQALTTQLSTPSEHINAGGIGSLPYDDDLGYVNFTINLNDPSSDPGVIIQPNVQTSVAEICFAMVDEAITDGSVCFSADWAQEGITSPAYNTGKVVIREWTAPNEQLQTNGVNFGNLSPASGDDACFNVSCQAFDEIGDIQCNDGMDNDDDGLVDCNDPGCGTAPICMDACSAQAPTISGN